MESAGREPGDIHKTGWVKHHPLEQTINVPNPQLGEIGQVGTQMWRSNSCQA
jgi:hypothetical protein